MFLQEYLANTGSSPWGYISRNQRGTEVRLMALRRIAAMTFVSGDAFGWKAITWSNITSRDFLARDSRISGGVMRTFTLMNCGRAV